MTAPAFCQIKSVPNTGAASAATIVFTPNEPVSANNTIVGWVGWNTASGTLSSVTDNLGNSYTLGTAVNDATQGRTHQQFYGRLTVSGAATITANLSGSSQNRTGQIAEYANVGAFDAQAMQFQSSPGTGPTDINNGFSLTTAEAGGLLWGNTEATNATSGTLLGGASTVIRDDEMVAPALGAGDAQTNAGISIAYFGQSVNARRITGALGFRLAIPEITAHPSNATVDRPAAATFTLTASGTGLTYQWQDNSSGSWANVSGGTGATTASYTTPATTDAMYGRKYRCVVTDSISRVSNTRNAKLLFAWAKDGIGRRSRAAVSLGALGVATALASSRASKLPVTLAGAATVSASAAGALGVAKPLAGAATVQAGAAANLSIAQTLAGAATVQAGAAGGLGVEKPLAGAATVQAGAAGSLGVEKPLAGAATVQAGATGSLQVGVPVALAGAAQVQAGAAGSLQVGQTLAGDATVQAGAAGALAVDKPLAGAATVQASAAGALAVDKPLAGAATVQAGAAGALAFDKPLAGAATVQAGAAGALDVGVYVTLAGQALVSASAVAAFLVDHEHLSRVKVAARPRYWFARSARGPFVARAKDRNWSVHA